MFLNEVAQYVNVGAVWDSRMQIGRESDPSGRGYIYTPVSGKETHPVTYVSWARATQFTNWMSGEAGDIYGGNLNGWNEGFTTRKDNQNAWGAGAISLPSWEEWIKSAYYDQSTNTVYKHATGRTDNLITTNDANYGNTVCLLYTSPSPRD